VGEAAGCCVLCPLHQEVARGAHYRRVNRLAVEVEEAAAGHSHPAEGEEVEVVEEAWSRWNASKATSSTMQMSSGGWLAGSAVTQW
jgi:hypothetical protein